MTSSRKNKHTHKLREHTAQTSNACAIVRREQKQWGGWCGAGVDESVWGDGCVYKHPGPGWSARVHPTVTGSEVSGSRVFLKKICEAELKWSTSGLRTEDHKGF